MKFSILILVAIASYGVTCAPVTELPSKYRLNSKVQPSSYGITIQPYLREDDGIRQFTFDGQVVISVVATEPGLTAITLHSKRLNLTETEVWSASQTKVDIANITTDQETDKLTVQLKNELVVQSEYQLRIKYVGQMDDDLHGFYRSSYISTDGKLVWVGATQFQRIEARRVFPCFDEPQYKANFEVTIKRHKTYNAFSNTRLEASQLDGDWYTDTFRKSPLMSTYLVAILVADFVPNADGNFSIISRSNYYDKTDFSLMVGQTILSAYDNYTGMPYDTLGNDIFQMATVPAFTHNGMENWGLILYKERVLVHHDGFTSLADTEYMITIMAHEICHMWFGNLIYPEYELDKQFVVDQIHLIFNTDAQTSAKPLSDSSVESPSEIASMFSGITYAKGAAIVRQFRHAMGEESFQSALQSYLRENAYGSTNPGDLFKHLKVSWPKDQYLNLDTYFSDWTEQAGYPLLHVEVAADGRSMVIKQKRFMLESADERDERYTVPITYTTNFETDFTNTTPKLYFQGNVDMLSVPFDRSVDWVFLNIQQSGYHRVNYDATTWQRLHKALLADTWSGIHEINRAQYVDDLFALGKRGDLDYEFVFQRLEYLETEIAYIPWNPALKGFLFLADRLGLENREAFGEFVSTTMAKVYEHLGFDGKPEDSILDIYNRNEIIMWCCKYGNEDCMKRAHEVFADVISNGTIPSVDIRHSIYCSAMRMANETEFLSLFKMYQNETNVEEKSRILGAVGCIKDPQLVDDYFHMILSDHVAQADKSAALLPLYSKNEENLDLVYELVADNFQELADAMGSYSSVANVISNIANRFTRDDQRQSLELFTKANREAFGNAATTLDRALVTVENNLKWAAVHLPKLLKYLKGGAVVNSMSASLLVIVFAMLITT